MLELEIRRLQPFTDLDPEALTTVAQHARILELPKRRVLVRRGRPLARDVYLLKGTVRRDRGLLGPAPQPVYRRGENADVFSHTNVRLLAVDVRPVDFLLHRARLPAPTVAEVEPWLERLFATELLRPLTPADWQLLLRLGDSLTLAGDTEMSLDDQVYVVQSGVVCLGERVMTSGAFFGEDFVLTGLRLTRNSCAVGGDGAALLGVPGHAVRSLVDRYPLPALPHTGKKHRIDLDAVAATDLRARLDGFEAGAVVEIVGGDSGARAFVFTTLVAAGVFARPVPR